MNELKEALQKMQEAIDLLQKVGKELFVKDEPLKVEKIAVKVNNERELDVVNKWNNSDWNVSNHYSFPAYVYLSAGRGFDIEEETIKLNGHTPVDFNFWAAQNNVEVPKPIIVSEDGVTLYDQDNFHLLKKIPATGNKWKICRENIKITPDSFAITDPENCKAFHSKEAALSWIEKQNNKSTSVKLYRGGTAEVYKDRIVLHGGIHLSPSDIEDILQAYNSLH